MSGCNRFLVNPGGWNDFSSGNLKRQQRRRKKQISCVAYTQTTIHHQLSPVCLWSFSVFGIRRRAGCMCCYVTVGWWCWYGRASADLKMIAFSVALSLIIPFLCHSSRGLLCCSSLHKYLSLFIFCTATQTRKCWACGVSRLHLNRCVYWMQFFNLTVD